MVPSYALLLSKAPRAPIEPSAPRRTPWLSRRSLTTGLRGSTCRPPTAIRLPARRRCERQEPRGERSGRGALRCRRAHRGFAPRAV